MKVQVKTLKAGDIVIEKTGCKALNNITLSQQTLTGIYLGSVMAEISYKSGLVVNRKQSTFVEVL